MIIPIGTKSTLALKPKLTIGLIAANLIVACITIPLMMGTGKALVKVQGERFAKQIRLYLGEHREDGLPAGVSRAEVAESIGELETAEDAGSFQIALYRTLQTTGVSPEAFRSYGETLQSREASTYVGPGGGPSGMLAEWKALRERERKITDESVFNRFGLIPGKMNRVYTFFTHIFIHGGIWHLLGNMLFLWIVGCLLEDSWGRLPFLAFYLAGGAFAGLVHCLQDTSSIMPLVGASGAIAAAMGAFTVRHFLTKIRFFYFFLVILKPYVGTFSLPAFVFLPFWFVGQIALHYLDGYLGGGSNVAYIAHIAGFMAGVTAALIMRITGFEERFLAPSVGRSRVKAGVLRDPRFDRACELLERGNREGARALFAKLLDDRPRDIELIRDIVRLYREKGLPDDSTALSEKALKLMILGENMDEAARFAADLIAAPGELRVNAQHLMRVAKWLTDHESYGQAHDLYRAIIASNKAPNVLSKAYLALARLLSEKMNNTHDALALIEEARTIPLDPEWEETMSQIEGVLKDRENSLYAPGVLR
ncbi:MAG: rhomboid family intramembrane serine protease [Candidatus Krumholzibacteriaceae bacterium]|jgi:membrane associated rhomboid family serine protease